MPLTDEEQLVAPRGLEDWIPTRMKGGAVLWRPPRPMMPPRHAALVFPHRRRFQWVMIAWLAFVIFCFWMAWATRGN